jgi:hypothetical protein
MEPCSGARRKIKPRCIANSTLSRWPAIHAYSLSAGKSQIQGAAGDCRAKATALHGHLENKKAVLIAQDGLLNLIPGDDLRSHTVARAVSSARRGLTTVFGMGTGVTLAV